MSKQVIPGVVRSKNLADDYKWYPLGRYELPPKEPPVTIIAAMKESDSAILLACDSEGFEAGNIRMGTGNKLQKHPSAPLAWGTAGNTTLGMEEGMEDFGDWLKNFPWPPQSLHTFRDQAAEASAKMNGRQRELARLSGRNVGEASTIDCLIVGWMGGPFIYELNDKGEVSSYAVQGFHAIGRGKIHAYISHLTLAQIQGIPAIDKFRWIMETVVRSAPLCGLPYYIWRVTSAGVEEGLDQGT